MIAMDNPNPMNIPQHYFDQFPQAVRDMLVRGCADTSPYPHDPRITVEIGYPVLRADGALTVASIGFMYPDTEDGLPVAGQTFEDYGVVFRATEVMTDRDVCDGRTYVLCSVTVEPLEGRE